MTAYEYPQPLSAEGPARGVRLASVEKSTTEAAGAAGLADGDRRLSLLVKAVPDYAIFTLDPKGRIATWNEGAARMKGYKAEQIIGQHVSVFYAREDVERGFPERLLKAAETQGSIESEGWCVRKDGSRFWASVSITAFRDEHGTLEGFGKVTRDLTQRKQAEERHKELSWRLVEAQDRERKRISLSLIDSVSPSCAALITELYQAKSRTEGEVSQRVDKCIALAEFLSREIRTTSYLLCPPSLETDGSLATLRAHLRGLAKQKGIAVDIDFPTQTERLPPPVAATLYRVVQEFLASIFRVPGNSTAEVRLAVQDGRLILQAGAEGRRISQEALAEAGRGVGDLGVTIAGMHARMARLGGSLGIDSSHSRTWITATLPVP
jgi:PAS domain S-box-containing protein